MKSSPAPKPAMAILGKRDLELGPFALGEQLEPGPWANWRLRNDEDGIAWLLFDKKDSSANTLSEPVLTELNAVLDKIERERPRGLVIRSGKPSGFIAGADITQFEGVTDPAQIETLLRGGHEVLDRLDRLPLPTVAVIHGYCLGGGLEVALACDHRLAIDTASFGFPEVLLGLHPGLGGTFRLTELINPVKALTMMLTGRTERARSAKRLGLVDAVTQERHVRAAVRSAVAGDWKPAKQDFIGKVMNFGPVRGFLGSRMRSEAEKKAPRKNYPAPSALIDLWEKHGGDRDAMQKAEVSSFAKLLVTTTAQNLVRVFFLRENLKSLADCKWGGKRVHVIGAGAMGGDIAAWCACSSCARISKALPTANGEANAFMSSAPAPWAAISRPGARGMALSSASATPSRSRSPARSSAPPTFTARSAATIAAGSATRSTA
jgi:3-hydroxyacyl-CoA dehydrogenase / enoyl-CoA hydratase / 3-hydroxybutyryl-CoA epimerase